jgi:hypothetical protein
MLLQSFSPWWGGVLVGFGDQKVFCNGMQVRTGPITYKRLRSPVMVGVSTMGKIQVNDPIRPRELTTIQGGLPFTSPTLIGRSSSEEARWRYHPCGRRFKALSFGGVRR